MVCTDLFGNVCNKTITLHFKILQPPQRFTIKQMVNAMINLYGRVAKIRVNVGTTQDLGHLNHLRVLPVNGCLRNYQTNKQRELFNYRYNMEDKHIAVYFIKATNPPLSGCASHPTNKPGCVITMSSSLWTLAHEVGHVLLLEHPDNHLNPSSCLYRRLMTGCGTGRIQDPPPDLIQVEINRMNSSNLCQNC